MNWFQQNRWLGSFLISVGVATLLSAFFLWRAHNSFEKASARFNEVATERNRLENLDPFPNDANYQKLKVHIEDYGAAVEKMKERALLISSSISFREPQMYPPADPSALPSVPI